MIQLNKSENQLVSDCSFSAGILLTFYHLIKYLFHTAVGKGKMCTTFFFFNTEAIIF